MSIISRRPYRQRSRAAGKTFRPLELRYYLSQHSCEAETMTFVTASETASDALTITLFGPMQVLTEGLPLPPLRSRKALWLLALLTLRHDRPVEREWLTGTLWPDVDQRQAFANLSPIVSEL